METLEHFYASIEAWGLHRYGWLFAAAVLVVPALVAGNMVQFYLTKLARREASPAALVKPLAGNLLIMIVCATVIAIALYLHF